MRGVGNLAAAFAASFITFAVTSGAAFALPPTGTIVNSASASYSDGAGRTYTTASSTVTSNVAAVAALVVSPKESAVTGAETVGQGVVAVRTFTIANVSNVTDAYTIASAASGAGKITGIAFAGPNGPLPVSVGTTVSPQVAPGGTIAVTVTIDTTGVAVGAVFAVDLVARTTNTATANGILSDNGREWVKIVASASLTGAGGAAILKTVDTQAFETAAPGSTLTYRIAFQNSGGAAATHVVLSDAFPVGLHPQLASVRVNDALPAAPATLDGQTVSVPIGTVAAGAQIVVTIAAVVDGAAVNGSSMVNVAKVSADGGSVAATTPASVLIGIADVVYDGFGGAQHPVGGAVVTVLDSVTKQPVVLPVVTDGAAPNTRNANPYTTAADGRYSFTVLFGAIKGAAALRRSLTVDPRAANVPQNYIISIVAPGYLPRFIGVQLTPDSSGLLDTVQLTSSDGQPLAQAGGFGLTDKNVVLPNVANVMGNMPLFTGHPVQVVKAVDRQAAQPGDRLTYTVNASNATSGTIDAPRMIDELPPGLVYAPGTARVDGHAVEPAVNGNLMIFPLAALTPGVPHVITYVCVVLPGTPPETTLTNNATVTGTQNGNVVSGHGSADTRILGGLFTDRAVITGRVYGDAAGSGRFVKGDRGVAGMRVVLENGESAITDGNGRYSFLGVRPGMHVLRLDPLTLPNLGGVRFYADRSYDSERSTRRLVHGTLDEGLLQDVNFALEVTP